MIHVPEGSTVEAYKDNGVSTPEQIVLDIKMDSLNVKSFDDSGLPEGFERLPIGNVAIKIDNAKIPSFTVMQINQEYEHPPVPFEYNEGKGRDEENPTHPDYIRKVAEIETKKSAAIIDNMIMWAVELLETPPVDDVTRLELLGRLEKNTNKIVIEFKYKKYVLFNNEANVKFLLSKLGVTQEAIDEAAARF